MQLRICHLKINILFSRFTINGFAVIPLNDPELKISVKCEPEKAIELRELYRSVEAAWHFNKKHWNNIRLNQDMDDKTVKYWIKHSVEQVVKSMSKKVQAEYWEK